MPAKMASFSRCHSAGVRASMSVVLGATQAERRRHAPGRVERVDEAVRPGADLLVGRQEGPGARVHEDQRAHEVRAGQDDAHDDPAAHGVAEQVDGPLAHRLEEGGAGRPTSCSMV